MNVRAGFIASADWVCVAILPFILVGTSTLPDLWRAHSGTWRNIFTAIDALSKVAARVETSTPQEAPIAIPFERYREFLVVVEGTIATLDRLKLLVDTGHHQTTIDTRIAGKLGLIPSPAQLEAFGKRIPAGQVVVPWLKIGPLKSLDLPVQAIDLRDAGEAMGLRADAIVGLDVLQGTCISMDYPRRILTFGRVDRWDFNIAFVPHSRYPIVQSTIDGINYRLLVDTGAEMIVIFQDAVPARHRIRYDGVLAGDHIAGTALLRRFTAVSVRLGDLELQGVPVFVSPGGAKLPYGGLIGPRWLTSTRLQLDMERMVLSWDR